MIFGIWEFKKDTSTSVNRFGPVKKPEFAIIVFVL